jgi:hypothetical protein
MNNSSDVLSVLFSIALSLVVVLLIRRLGGERLRGAKEKLRASWIRWLILAAVVVLMVCLVVFRSS